MPELLHTRSTAPSGESRATHLRYIPGLDGIRAVAVIGVIAFHAGVGWAAKGGFLGVDVFFVLSGYLITSLLLSEGLGTRTIALGAFWARRARRLLPALFVMIAAVAIYGAFLAPPDTLAQLRADALSTLGYAANWHLIVAGQGYFASLAYPSPLLHTWSLAIEEQFYLVWPLVVLVTLRARKPLRALGTVAAAGAIASAAAMALLYHPADTARVYYGTDTRAQSLLIGALLSVVLTWWARRGHGRATSRWGRALLGTAGLAGLAEMVWMWARVDGSGPFVYKGGFALCAVGVAGLIASVVQMPRGVTGRMLALAPLRYTGRISYGLYLWHWPIFVALNHANTGLVGTPLLAARVGATYAVSVLSFHLVEQPIRRGALRSWRAWVLAPVGAGAAAASVLVVTMPALPSAAVASVAASGSSLASPTRSATAGLPLRTAAPTLPQPPVKVLVVGDSVALTLGLGLGVDAPRYGTSVDDEATVGCGIARGGPLHQSGVLSYPLATCDAWPSAWANLVNEEHPGVAALLIGRWEVVDRVHDGRWTHLGEPDFDAYITQELQLAVQVLGSTGAKVVLFTTPYFQGTEAPDGSSWPENDPHRVDVLNDLIRQVAAAYPSQVTVVPLGSILCPDGTYTSTIDGTQVRYSDGVHISLAGGEYAGNLVLPELVDLARGR